MPIFYAFALAMRFKNISGALAVLVLSLACVANAPAAVADFGSASVPFVFSDNRILVSCRIDGRGPFVFIVDTGGDLALDTATARRLHLATKPAGTVGGVGNHLAPVSTTRIASFDLGTAHASDQDALVLDLSEIRENIGFARLDGIVGYSFLKHYAVKVDIDAGVLTLSRARGALPGGARAIPFALDGTLIHIPATIAGYAGQVVVDTGDRSALTIFGRFATEHGLYGKFGGFANALTGFGIGGAVYGDLFRLPDLQIFGDTLHGIVSRASRQHAGAFATQLEAGSIGGGLLKRYDIVYDYPHSIMYVWPSKTHASVDAFDRAGLWISLRNGRGYVAAVLPNGPAWNAGLRTGDAGLTIAGRPVTVANLWGLRALTALRPPGTAVEFSAVTAGVRRTHRVILKTLL
jgi:hypothetical protein